MGNYITLIGADTVGQAGREMQRAAEDMITAANRVEESILKLARVNEEFLDRLERLLIEDRQKRGWN